MKSGDRGLIYFMVVSPSFLSLGYLVKTVHLWIWRLRAIFSSLFSPFVPIWDTYLFNRKGLGYLLTPRSCLVWLQFLYLTIFSYNTFLLVLFSPLLFNIGHIQIMLTSVICKGKYPYKYYTSKSFSFLLEIIFKHIFHNVCIC